MTKNIYLSAKEAASELGISLATLYAYVSRGLIRSEVSAEHKRSHRYLQEDIHRLKERKAVRQDPSQIIDDVLPLGAPIFESAITLIADEHLYFRGQDALALASTCTVEAAATFIWTGEFPPDPAQFFKPATYTPPPFIKSIRELLESLAPLDAFQVLLPLTAAHDLTAYDLRPFAIAHTGANILYLLTVIAAGTDKITTDIATTLQQAWMPQKPEVVSLINKALILCADHELNLPSYTARCTASAGSNPYAVVSTGLATVQGARHAGLIERVEGLFREIEAAPSVGKTMLSRLKRGDELPGFGHALYPHGDPRAALLLNDTAAAFPDSPAVMRALEIKEQALKLIDEQPAIDFSLVTLARTLGLPSGGAATLLVIGRAIGWLGHAIEQYEANRAINPKLRYVGHKPG